MPYSVLIFLRVLAATLGAYLVSAAVSFALVPLLQLNGFLLLSDAVYFSVMLTYVVFFLLVIACFALVSVGRLYALLFSLAAISGVIHWVSTL